MELLRKTLDKRLKTSSINNKIYIIITVVVIKVFYPIEVASAMEQGSMKDLTKFYAQLSARRQASHN